jgi:hypothetical protein
MSADLADRSARAVLPARLIKLGVTVDILVNNAGFSTMGVVIPGVANRVAAAMARVTPRTLLLPVQRTHPGLK